MKISALFIFLCFKFSLYSQSSAADLTLILHQFKKENHNGINEKKVKLERSTSFIKTTAFIPFFIYQKVFSEQIAAECEFDMSCSRFGINSIKTFGILKGIFLTADRLMRCNGQVQLETESYLINYFSGKTIDEPWMFQFKD